MNMDNRGIPSNTDILEFVKLYCHLFCHIESELSLARSLVTFSRPKLDLNLAVVRDSK